ncbi:MAG: 2-amino-4-hydroxy-6-hydroxymethyldihydropteridine diphosphokinase [Candidatus Marinimicrobia bacterium]|nr:2-amino-4-hydroxy-6-hydroxymethyldihydropteridine diphosphokinase [Candidatus Neomarinimicrobiota bacterium]MBL7059592.1 2-amino-4-hydroxy-6-hydroxymethyldihydropteridine diphosphokinase [Candidatus Neomarinimicrobiota bacterium]
MSELVFLSLGSNLGDREANLAEAITALETYPEIMDVRSASYYDTPPLINTDQPHFLNTVIQLTTDFKPFQLLDAIQHIESMLGRSVEREKNEPRIIDIDILLHGNSVIETDELTLPHPQLPYRKFVLVPFNEIAPDVLIPIFNRTVSELLNHCPDQSIIKKHRIESQA